MKKPLEVSKKKSMPLSPMGIFDNNFLNVTNDTNEDENPFAMASPEQDKEKSCDREDLKTVKEESETYIDIDMGNPGSLLNQELYAGSTFFKVYIESGSQSPILIKMKSDKNYKVYGSFNPRPYEDDCQIKLVNPRILTIIEPRGKKEFR